MRQTSAASRGSIVLLSAATLLVAGSLACQQRAPVAEKAAGSENAPKATLAKNKFTVDLVEKPAFPLPKHLEQKDIAAGTIPFPTLFDDGDKLFHTPYNGLDGVGMQHTPAGTPLHRFSVGPIAGSPVPVGVQSCGSCHTLKAMGWGGNIGPNLDSAKPPYDLAVTRLTNGAGAMPSFKGTLTDTQLKCVATVIATITKGGGAPSTQAVACKGL